MISCPSNSVSRHGSRSTCAVTSPIRTSTGPICLGGRRRVVRGVRRPPDDVIQWQPWHVYAHQLVGAPHLGRIPPRAPAGCRTSAGTVSELDSKLGARTLGDRSAHPPGCRQRRERPARPDLTVGYDGPSASRWRRPGRSRVGRHRAPALARAKSKNRSGSGCSAACSRLSRMKPSSAASRR